MPKPRQDWVPIKWGQLRFDARLKRLPNDAERYCWIKIMATCVNIRRDTYEAAEVTSPYFADYVGVEPALLASTVASSLAAGLFAKGPRGSVTVLEVQANSPKLRGWNENPQRFLCGPIADPSQIPPYSPPRPPSYTPPLTGTEPPHDPPAPCEDIREAWNNVAAKAGCVKCRDLTESRKRKIKIRWRDAGWRDQWLDAINYLPERKFALGENDRGWRMDFDFFLKPDTVTGIMEGKYMGGSASGKKTSPGVACAGCGKDKLEPGMLGACPSCGAAGLCYKCRNNHNCGETKGDRDDG